MIYAVIASTIAHLLYIKKKLSAKPLDSLNKSAQKNEADFAGIRAGSGPGEPEQLFGLMGIK